MKSNNNIVTRQQTKEELSFQDRKEKLYEFYGIPYDIFDGEENNSEIDKDRKKARILIMEGKSIPKDLEKRLLQYKELKLLNIKYDIIMKIVDIAQLCKKIDYIYAFDSSIEESCSCGTCIGLAIVSNVTRSRLFRSGEYNNFLKALYSIDIKQEYDILQFNNNDSVADFIKETGVIIYKREGAV